MKYFQHVLYKHHWNAKSFHLNIFCYERRDLLCSHSNGDLFIGANNMLCSCVKISCFRTKAHLVFHWSLYNKCYYHYRGHCYRHRNHYLHDVNDMLVRVLFSDPRLGSLSVYKAFSHDVMSAILVSQDNKMAAMLLSQTSPVGVEPFS